MNLDSLTSFLDSSPSPWHAAHTAVQELEAAGFRRAEWSAPAANLPPRGFVQRGAAVVAWDRGSAAKARSPFRIVGAHTDSPCLRIKPNPDTGGFGWKQLAVEVYGGALLTSWLDRDLGLAGRIELADGRHRLIDHRSAIARVPQLAIHLDRDVNERGLTLDKQMHLTPVWGVGTPIAGEFAS